jgi:hypothetical protein
MLFVRIMPSHHRRHSLHHRKTAADATARRAHSTEPAIADLDPADPSQQLDEAGGFQIEPLEFDAEPASEGEDELDDAVARADPGDDDTAVAPRQDVGELYGLHLPPAMDRDLTAAEDHDSFARADSGENWIESLEQASTEYGPVVEREVDPTDDTDHHVHHATDTRDRPVADRGSGGLGGR